MLDDSLKTITIELIEKGYTIQQLATAQSVPYNTMVARLAKWGLKTARQIPQSSAEITKRDQGIIEMFNNGSVKAVEVAKHFKITRERVRQILIKNGIVAGANRDNECKRKEQLIIDVAKRFPAFTAREQGEIIGVNSSTVLNYRKKLGIRNKRGPEFYEARRKARFWANVDITADPDECWNWTGFVNKYLGYPYSGRVTGSSPQRAQVIVWELTRGAPQHNISTTCDNQLCCNPNHLEDVKWDKLMEKRARTYLREPERRRNSGATRKYDDNTVKYLKELKKTMTYAELHRATKVSQSTLRSLMKRSI